MGLKNYSQRGSAALTFIQSSPGKPPPSKRGCDNNTNTDTSKRRRIRSPGTSSAAVLSSAAVFGSSAAVVGSWATTGSSAGPSSFSNPGLLLCLECRLERPCRPKRPLRSLGHRPKRHPPRLFQSARQMTSRLAPARLMTS